MAEPRDYYDMLGVSRTATDEQIRKAYRALARKLHPDVNKEPDAARKFAEVQEAYDILTDATKRREYDPFGRAGVGMGGRGPGGAGHSGGGPWSYSWSGGPGAGSSPGSPGFGGVEAEDIASIFEQFMGGGGGMRGAGVGVGPGAGRARRSRGPVAQRGADIRHTITVPFMTAARGGTESLRITRGGKDAETVEVRIPQGIEPRAKLRLKGQGQPGVQGGEAGDLILTVEVGSHPQFRREGLDLLLDVAITIVEAALGATVRVPLLDQTADLRIPPGSSSGKMLRMKGKGLHDAQGKVGDFYAVLQIVAPPPDALSAEQADQLRRLGDHLKNPRSGSGWTDIG